MDCPRFDAVLRRAVAPLNRRAGLGALAALAALSLPGAATPARAKKRKKRCGCRPACGGDRPFCCNGRCRAECCGDGQCGTGEVCLRGACVVPCPLGTGCPVGLDSCCAGACVDTDTNALNCGACGAFCAPPGTCENGSCAAG